MGGDELMFFSGRPGAMEIYRELERRISSELPDTKILVQKTQITFKNRYIYGCASLLPVRRKSERPDPYLTVTFGLGYPKRSDRVAAATEARPGRWTHHVLVGSPEEIDDELMGWMREAYEFSEVKR